eukprot:COSAG06_NODE_5392_length_3506_cov_1.770968_8_plen_92_part_00
MRHFLFVLVFKCSFYQDRLRTNVGKTQPHENAASFNTCMQGPDNLGHNLGHICMAMKVRWHYLTIMDGVDRFSEEEIRCGRNFFSAVSFCT